MLGFGPISSGASGSDNLRLTGVIRHWNAERGFGFAMRDDGAGDIFVHIREIDGDVEALPVGTRVEFEVGTNERSEKVEAQNVSVVDDR